MGKKNITNATRQFMLIIVLLLTACHKDAKIEPITPVVTEKQIEVSHTTVKFEWTVDYPGTIYSLVEMSLQADMGNIIWTSAGSTNSDKKFTATSDNLTAGTKYYYRYVTYNPYNFKSEVMSFTTREPIVPMVTAFVDNIMYHSVVGVGKVIDDGYATVTERGFCWGKGHNPTLSDSHISQGMGIGQFTAQIAGLDEGATYYLRAYAVNSKGIGYSKEVVFMTIGAIDLGLPSGVLWATINVNLDDYFAWGETQPKDTYNWSTYQYCNGNGNSLTKYCTTSSYGYNGFTDNTVILLSEDDAATVKWGNDWRIPTKEEWEELCNNTSHTWTTLNDVNGMLFTATNGNSIFLPAVGYCNNSNLYYTGSSGFYWSSSLDTDYPYYAWNFYFNSDSYDLYKNLRHNGLSVRAVRSGQN